MMGADSFLPSELLKLKWKAGRLGVVVLCCSIGRTGSMANVRAESLGIACAAFCVIALIGFFVIACTISFLVFCSGLSSLAITCAGVLVIACTVSLLVSCS